MNLLRIAVLAAFCISALLSDPAAAAEKKRAPSPWADWVERDFPFFSSMLDARSKSHALLTNNITPRGLVLNLGQDCWVCFDIDLLRVAAMWHGKGVTENALAPGSYHPWGGKSKGGLFPAPQPDGDVWLANGIYPGWQVGEKLNLADPRDPAPDPNEVGRGPLPDQMGRFKSVRLVRDGVVLEYRVGKTDVSEWMTLSTTDGRPVIERHFQVNTSNQPLLLVLGAKTRDSAALKLSGGNGAAKLSEEESLWTVRLAPRKSPVRFCVSFTGIGIAPKVSPRPIPNLLPPTRWPQEIVTRGKLSKSKESYVVDNIALPFANPWHRNVRPGDVQFLKDGTGVAVTLDGDVWLVRGLQGSLEKVRWKRFASGLHEPMTLAIRDEEIHVFDKNGIWRLRDTNGDDEADVHELFSNAFGQTLDMREFPSTIRLAPDREFVIAKGGQQKTFGKHNGSVLRISADGLRSTVLGYGFRQPNIGVNLRTGLVTSSDQEGQYIPSTPLHIVRDGQFYGYLDDQLHGREKYPAPIAEPLTWMPHAVNASAISQVWLFGAKMGALNDAFVHIGFNRPELFKIMLNERGSKPQAAVVSITTGFEYPPLNGSVNPNDGQLYIAGFQVAGWGNSLDALSGLGRVRYTGARVTLPREVVPMDKGVLLRFDEKLDSKTALNPDNYSLASWHYIRTYKYGSAQYKADGQPGIDWHAASSAYLSKDGRSVFIGVPQIKPVMQLRLGWSLATADGLKFENNAYTTPYELAKFDPITEGFDNIAIDLTPRVVARQDNGPVTVEEGRRLYQLMGCVACHSVNGSDIAKVGPTWTGLFGSERPVVINRKRINTKVDAAYIRESILDPSAKIVSGFEKGEYAMPSYAGVVTDSQIESLILFIKAVKDGNLPSSPGKAAPAKPTGSFE